MIGGVLRIRYLQRNAHKRISRDKDKEREEEGGRRKEDGEGGERRMGREDNGKEEDK